MTPLLTRQRCGSRVSSKFSLLLEAGRGASPKYQGRLELLSRVYVVSSTTDKLRSHRKDKRWLCHQGQSTSGLLCKYVIDLYETVPLVWFSHALTPTLAQRCGKRAKVLLAKEIVDLGAVLDFLFKPHWINLDISLQVLDLDFVRASIMKT